MPIPIPIHLNYQDSDILRVCVDDKRPTLIDRAKGKMSPGLYMRDIAEVRGGDFSYDFRKNASPPTSSELCMSLIGSERTISLELPGKVGTCHTAHATLHMPHCTCDTAHATPPMCMHARR